MRRLRWVPRSETMAQGFDNDGKLVAEIRSWPDGSGAIEFTRGAPSAAVMLDFVEKSTPKPKAPRHAR